ncbi:protein of unknown function [Bradyrhizobium sp. Gha]|nr:protein of unknown function [Bradyrhizobium sp. Gha]
MSTIDLPSAAPWVTLRKPRDGGQNTFANNAFENFEIAAYKSLIALCGAAGVAEAKEPLEASLKEEQRMCLDRFQRREGDHGVSGAPAAGRIALERRSDPVGQGTVRPCPAILK